MPLEPNIFYSYSVQEDNEKFYVMAYDLDRVGHEICACDSQKVADHICEHFDNLAMAEEVELLHL